YLAHSYFDEFGLPAVSVRPFNVYGPGQVGSGAIHRFTVRALAGEQLVIHGDGSQIRAWCYVDDIVEALLKILDRDEAVGEVFNIGNPRSVVTVFDLAARIKRLAGSDSEIVFKPLHYTDVEMRIPNVDKARKLLAYAWGGRLHGWRELPTGVSGTGTLHWTPTSLRDGSYLVTVCYKDRGKRLGPVITPAEQRPGAAEATVSRPPWRYSGCLVRPRVVRAERLAAYVNSTGSFEPGSRPPLVVSADGGKASVRLEQDCSGRRFPMGLLPR